MIISVFTFVFHALAHIRRGHHAIDLILERALGEEAATQMARVSARHG
jgi:hypothetical protein